MESNTQTGLFLLMIGLIITTVFSLITSLSGFLTRDIAVSMAMSMFGMISLVGAILMFVGAILFFLGRKEFGKKHHKNVKNAAIIFLITFVTIVALAVVFIMMMIFSAITALSPIYGNTSYVASTFAAPTTLFVIVISIVGAVLGGLIYYFALIDLEDETGKKILYVAIVASIALSIVMSYYVSGMLSGLYSSLSTPNTNYSAFPYTQNFGAIGILGLIPNLLYLYSFYNPYKRMKEGELQPVTASAGQTTSRTCPHCGKPVPPDTTICPFCYKII